LSGITHTLTIGTYERVTLIEVWLNSDLFWYRVRLTLNTGTMPEYDATPSTGTNTLYSFVIAAGEEFTGFNIYGKASGCSLASLIALSRPATCSIYINLSTVNGQSQNVITDPAKTISFTATPWECGTSPTIEY
jgi:hypothetical protein